MASAPGPGRRRSLRGEAAAEPIVDEEKEPSSRRGLKRAREPEQPAPPAPSNTNSNNNNIATKAAAPPPASPVAEEKERSGPKLRRQQLATSVEASAPPPPSSPTPSTPRNGIVTANAPSSPTANPLTLSIDGPKRRGRKPSALQMPTEAPSSPVPTMVSAPTTPTANAPPPIDASLYNNKEEEAAMTVRLEDDIEWRQPRALILRAKTGFFVRPEYRCYCGLTEPAADPGDVVCDGCNRIFHQRCLTATLDVRPLPGDVCYEFLCAQCVPRRDPKATAAGQGERFRALAKSWCDVAEITLFNLTRQYSTNRGKGRRTTFNIVDDMLPFVEQHRLALCYGLEIKTARALETQLKAALTSNTHVFVQARDTGGQERWTLIVQEDPMYLDKVRCGREVLTIAQYEALRREELRAKLDKERIKMERRKKKAEDRRSSLLARSGSPLLTDSQQFGDATMAGVTAIADGDSFEATGPLVAMGDAAEPYEEPTYEVERIIGKRFDAMGRVQYRIKWGGFDNRFNSWVAPENMDAEEKIREYEAQLLREKASDLPKDEDSGPLLTSSSNNAGPNDKASEGKKEKKGKGGEVGDGDVKKEKDPDAVRRQRLLARSDRYFEAGDAVKRVIGVNRMEAELAVQVEWIGHRKTSWILSTTLAQKDPLTLIRYYEGKLVFGKGSRPPTS